MRHTLDVSRPMAHLPRMGVVLRDGERVSPLELFFDLVFVLAITQCTALMARDPTVLGIARGLSCSAFCGGRGWATRG
jgi:low temperature requirement protein LtrA